MLTLPGDDNPDFNSDGLKNVAIIASVILQHYTV